MSQKRKLLGLSRMSHVDLVVRCVVTPPNTNPLPNRALPLTSKPLYTVSLVVENVAISSTAEPTLLVLTLYMVIASPPPVGNRVSDGP